MDLWLYGCAAPTEFTVESWASATEQMRRSRARAPLAEVTRTGIAEIGLTTVPLPVSKVCLARPSCCGLRLYRTANFLPSFVKKKKNFSFPPRRSATEHFLCNPPQRATAWGTGTVPPCSISPRHGIAASSGSRTSPAAAPPRDIAI